MTTYELLANGFRRHGPGLSRADDLFQLRISDKNGTRYFVEVYHWLPSQFGPENFEAEVHFNDGCTFHPAACLRVHAYSVKEWSVENLMKWASELWDRLTPNYYERER